MYFSNKKSLDYLIYFVFDLTFHILSNFHPLKFLSSWKFMFALSSNELLQTWLLTMDLTNDKEYDT